MSNQLREMEVHASISKFHNVHQGDIGLFVGNGKSLSKLPVDFLEQYPSFGANTIHLKEDFTPTYYAAVDSRVMREFKDGIMDRFEQIPKFLPTPNLDKWEGMNIYRFHHRPGALWPRNNEQIWPRDFLSENGITYGNITHVIFQIMYFMGFSVILCVGMDHLDPLAHFWGRDEKAPGIPNLDEWAEGYQALREGFHPRTAIINISVDTELPASVLPRGNWRDYYYQEQEL